MINTWASFAIEQGSEGVLDYMLDQIEAKVAELQIARDWDFHEREAVQDAPKLSSKERKRMNTKSKKSNTKAGAKTNRKAKGARSGTPRGAAGGGLVTQLRRLDQKITEVTKVAGGVARELAATIKKVA